MIECSISTGRSSPASNTRSPPGPIVQLVSVAVRSRRALGQLSERPTMASRLSTLSQIGILCLLFLLSVNDLTHCEESPAITVAEAVQYALAHNPEIQSERCKIPEARGEVLRAGRIANPSVEFEYVSGKGSMSNAPVQPFVLGKLAHIPLAPGKLTRFMTIRVSKDLEMGLQRGLRKRVAGKHLRKTELDVADSERHFTGEVKQAHANLLHRQDELVLADTVLSMAEQLLGIAQARFSAGETSMIDVKLAKVEAAQARNRRLQASGALDLSRHGLNRLLGRPVESPLAAKEAPLPRWTMPGLTVQELVSVALFRREDLQGLQIDAGKAQDALVLARRERIPDIEASATYERLSGSNLFGGQVNLQLPFFDWNRASIAEWKASGRRLSLAATARRELVGKEVQAAFQRLEVAWGLLDSYESGILQETVKTLDLVITAYRMGEVGLTAVIQAQKQTSEARSGYLEAQHETRSAATELETAVSGDLTEIIGHTGEVSAR